MRARRSKSASVSQLVGDPAIHRCVVACLRVIHDAKLPGSSLPSEVTEFLGALTTRRDLAEFFPTGAHTTTEEMTGQSARKNLKHEIPPGSDDSDEINDLFSELRRDAAHDSTIFSAFAPNVAADQFIGAPAESIVRAIHDADKTVRQQLTTRLLERWTAEVDANEEDWLVGNVRVLGKLFGFTATEETVALLALSFCALQSRNDVVSKCVEELFGSRLVRRQATTILGKAVDLPAEDVAVIFESSSALRSCGVFEQVSLSSYDLDDALKLSHLGQMFAAESFASETAVREKVLKPIVTNDGPELVLSHLSKKKSDMEALIEGAIRTGAAGVNLLLYGPPGTGKTEFVKKLANDLKVDCYEVGYTADGSALDASRDNRLSYLRLINQLIKPEEQAVVLLDEAEDIFQVMAAEGGGMRARRRRTGSKAWVNALLEKIRIPTIWITNDIDIDPAHLRRFAYVAEFGIPPINVRRQIVRAHAVGLTVADETIEELARNDALTPATLGAATRFVRIAGIADGEIDEALLRHTKNTQDAMGLAPSGTVRHGVTKFDPRFVNLEAGLSVETICTALRRTGRGTLLFSGPPGSGKTQLASHLAEQLNRELVYRTGSDLLNMYVGETEQRIARLFRNSDPEREVIFLDEAEGLLGSRENATRSWELTHVNEFLRQIEQYRGIFIAATNHSPQLDSALMRRFAFRLKFKALSFEQRLAMFSEITGYDLKPLSPSYSLLKTQDQLTAGDFANVKRRLDALGAIAGADEWVLELEREHSDNHPTANTFRGFA